MTIEWNGPRDFREKMYNRVPELEEWKAWLEMKLAELEDMDCGCDLSFSLGRAQDYINSWPQIFDEGGGI